MQTTFECTVCGNEAKWFCGHGCKTPYCGVSCARSVYDTHKELCSGLVGEGAVDVLRDENAFFNSLNLRLEMSRRNVIRDTFNDLEITFEKHKKELFKGGLKNKINYFVRALRRVIIEKGQVKTLGEKLSKKEEEEYLDYITKAEKWLATLEKKK